MVYGWNEIEFRNFDWAAQPNTTFDFYVAGSLVQAGIAFQNNIESVRNIYYHNFTPDSIAYWDEVKVWGTRVD